MPCSTILFGIIVYSLSFFFQNESLAAPHTDPGAKAGKTPFKVVIDPGHGGTDHGTVTTIGKKTVMEKDLSLGLAIRLSRLLESPKYWRPLGRPIKVLLTRSSDREVSLESRAELAQKEHADLFLSLHVNSDPKGKARGIETYILNNTDSKSSSKLEEIENKMSQKYAGARPNSLLIRSIAADAVMENSRAAAEAIHSSVTSHLKKRDIHTPNRGVRQALLYVLLDSQVPSVLFEAFYLSNPQDRDLITKGEVRETVAEGLARGVLRYLVIQ